MTVQDFTDSGLYDAAAAADAITKAADAVWAVVGGAAHAVADAAWVVDLGTQREARAAISQESYLNVQRVTSNSIFTTLEVCWRN